MNLHNTRCLRRDWERDYTRSQKILLISNLFFLFSGFYGKSGEFDKNREKRRQHIKSGDSRSMVGVVLFCRVLSVLSEARAYFLNV